MRTLFAITLLFTLAAARASSAEDQREWTAMNGHSITAAYVRTTGDVIELRSDKNAPLQVHRNMLSDRDWLYLAMKDREFLNIVLDVGTVSRAQRPKVSESGYITPSIKYDKLRFRLDRKNNLLIDLNNESWRLPLTIGFWEICDNLSPFASGKKIFTSNYMWETDTQFYGIGGPVKENPRVLLRIRLTDSNDAKWMFGNEGKDVATILIDGRGLEDLQRMPALTAKAQDALIKHPRISRVQALLKDDIKQHQETFSLNNVKQSHDQMESATFYTNIREHSIELADHETVTLSLYIGQQRDVINLKFKIIFTAMNWLFIDKVIFLSDKGHRAVVDVENDRDSKVVDGGGILEWADVKINPNDMLKFADASSIKCRLEGQFRRDFDLSTNQLMAMREILATYLKIKETDQAALDAGK
jgi:hypothetical protein